jgi:hypothetical protein
MPPISFSLFIAPNQADIPRIPGNIAAMMRLLSCLRNSKRARDNRISLTIDHDVSDPMAITGLSMAAQAQPVTDLIEVAKAMNLLQTRYPEYAAFPMPKPEDIAVYRVFPKVISVLDYSKGFGHSDLVTV